MSKVCLFKNKKGNPPETNNPFIFHQMNGLFLKAFLCLKEVDIYKYRALQPFLSFEPMP